MSETRARDTANVATELVDIAIDVVNLDAEKLDVAGGKILQVVRATDSTRRDITSTSFVDVTGMSITITPSLDTSAILVVASVSVQTTSSATTRVRVTDSSNNPISGAEYVSVSASIASQTLMAYSTPATTSATTYKMQMLATSGTSSLRNDNNTGQMYALEISA